MPTQPPRTVRRMVIASLAILTLALALLAVHHTRAQSPPPLEEGAFSIKSPPERLPSGIWCVRWESIPGRLYILQRWNSGDLGVPGVPPWVDVAMVRAVGAEAFADDPVSVAMAKGFYQVMQVDEGGGGDLQQPVVSAIISRFTAANLASAARLTVTATDNVGVTRVEFFNGAVRLGAATREEGDRWSYLLPLDPRELGARFLVARAFDAAGNFANSPVFPLGLVDPDHFVPLGTNGLPVEGGVVEAVAPGAWGPVEYRPGGRSLFGAGAGFFLRFPSGVLLRDLGGRKVLEFTHVVAGFGVGYPLQFPAQLERNRTPARQLAVGPVSVDQIREIFELPADHGLAVRLYDRFDLEWAGGAVDDGGILGARFRMAGSAFPLPRESGRYPEFRIDFTRSRGVAIPFHGEFELPDGTATPTRVVVGAGSPLWLTLKPDGQMSLVGSAGVELGNGGYFRADVRLDDPFYQLSIAADRARLAALGSLAELLPNNATSCVPAQASDAQLAQATRCLRAFREALVQFSGSLAAAESGLGATGVSPSAPPSPFEAAASVLEAWAHSALATTQAGLRLDLIRDLVRQAGQGASGAHDLDGAMVHRLALARVHAAMIAGGLSSTPESRAELERAMAEAEVAALARVQDPDAVASLGALTRVIRAALETESLRQQANLPPSALLAEGLADLLNRFAQRYTSSLGVTGSDEFTPVNNPVIRGMDRFTAAEHVRNLVDLMVAAQELGVELTTTLLDEALGQLATQLFFAVDDQLAAAEAAGDYPAYLLALQDLVELMSARELAVFPDPPALAALPGIADLPGHLDRLGNLLAFELDKPLGDRSLNNQAAEIRALVAVFRSVPASVNFASGPLRRAFDQLESRLALATSEVALASLDRAGDLLQVLEAGMLHAEFGRRFGFEFPVAWESVRLPALAARLALVASETGGWSELGEAVRMLLDAADRQGLLGQQAPRHANLGQAAVLLQAARGTARRMIQENGGGAGWVDLLLPGDISVDEVAGSVRYHRINQTFAGSFRGQLQLPKFGTRLNVQNASVRGGGAFDLSASGELVVPAGTPLLTAQVPDFQPLHLRWTPAEGLRLSGAALFTLTNGMFFRGQIRLEDPIYQFHLEAGGLQIALARDLATRMPSLPPASAFQRNGTLDETGLEHWSGYLSGLSETLGALGLSTNRTVAAAGERPEFVQAAPADTAMSALDTWSQLSALEGHFGARSNSLETLDSAVQVFTVLSAGNVTAPERHAEAVGDPTGTPDPVIPVGNVDTPAPTLAGVLQLDLGQSDAQGVVPGPAQAMGRSVPGATPEDIVLPDQPGTWNAVPPQGLTSVRFADGALATAVSVAVGRGISPGDLAVEPSRSPIIFAIGDEPARRRGGVFDTPLMEDSLGGLSGGSGPAGSLGVRIRGLPPGYYYVFGMITSDREDLGRFVVHAGPSDIPSTAHEARLLRRPEPGSEVTVWTPGQNFTLGTAEIRSAGMDLLVVSERQPSVPPIASEVLAGQLAGIQVLAPRVRLLHFGSDAARIPLGGRVRLAWDTRHGQRVLLTGSDQTRLEFGPDAGRGEVVLSPSSTVIYTLTVTNRNGPALTSNLVVRVDGAQAIQNGVVTAVREQFALGERTQELVAAAAECALRGNDDCEIPVQAICAMVQPFLRQMRDTLLDCTAVTRGSSSVESLITTLADTLKVVQDTTAQTQTLGCAAGEDDVDAGDFLPFAECVLLEVYARSGLTNTLVNGTNRVFGVDSARMRSFQVPDSLRLVRSTLRLSADAIVLGSDLGIQDDWLVAHATNMLRRIEEGAGSLAVAAARLDSELAGFMEGIALIDALAPFDPARIPTASPELRQGVATVLLERVRSNLAQYQGSTFGLWLTNPRYWEQEVVHLQQALVLNETLRDASVSNLIHTAVLDVSRAMKDGADFSDEIRPHDVRTLQFLQPFLDRAEVAEAYAHRVRIALEFIEDQLPTPAAPVSLERLQRFDRFIGQLADLQLLMGRSQDRGVPVDVPQFLQPLALATNVLETARLSARQLKAEGELMRYVRAVFEARRNLKVGLSTLLENDPLPGAGALPGGASSASLVASGTSALRQFGSVSGGASSASPLNTATEGFGLNLVRQSYLAIQDADSLTRERVSRLNAATDEALSPEFSLPAGLRVDRVFGEFLFNRQTGFLQGGFGGAIAFPDSGFSAVIERARVANDGSFSIHATTATPLAPGGFFLDALVNVDFVPTLGLSFLGTGSLTLPANVTTQTLSLSLFYDEPTRRVGYSILDEDTNLQLGDDFVVFDFGGGLELGTATPTGKVTLRGSVGLFARSKPLPASVTRSNYWLTVDDAVVSLAIETEATVVRVEGGTLRLPEFFSTGECLTNVAGFSDGPSVVLNPAAPIRLTFRPDRPTPEFSGSFGLSRLGMRVPGMTNLALEVCRATLQFPSNGLPRLTNLTATVQIPIPGRTNRIDIADASWSVDGFPVGTVGLHDNLELFQAGGFDLQLLGSVSNQCSLSTALTVARGPGGQPFFRLEGGLEFGMPPEVIGSTNGGRVFLRSCGFVSGGPDATPEVGINDLAVGGTFRLGGPQGLLIEDGLLALEGLTNLYAATEARPFVIRVSGNANVPLGPRLGLQDARFTFTGAPAPRFTLAGFSIAQNPEYEVAPGLALNVSAASLLFLDPERPLPQLLFPDNVVIGLSATAAIPPGPQPVITGTVQGLTLRLNNGRLEPRIAGFGISLVNFEIPPLTLTGEVFLGGLDTVSGEANAVSPMSSALRADAPSGLFFAGRVGGSLNDVGVKALVAFDMNGPIGVCLDANAGPAGIPLGPTGFLLTGVQGGVSFKNSNGDPCDFATFYPLGADGRPLSAEAVPHSVRAQRPGAAMSWAEYRESLARTTLAAEAERAMRRVALQADAPPEFPCPTGDCPPASVNILCQPHPDEVLFPDTVIMKFSSLDARTLEQFGITRSFVESLGATPAAIGAGVAASIRGNLDPLVPRADPALLGSQRAGELNALIQSQLDGLELTFAELIRLAAGGGGSIYDKVLEVAYAGVPCPDATVKLAGTFSHAAVSTALSGTVGVVLSSSGSAGLVGSLNVLGVPVGRMRSFVNVTDERGDPNPSYCGEALFALGPIEFGQMRSRFECPGCVTGFLGAFAQLTGCMAEAAIRTTLGRVAPEQAPRPIQEALGALSDEQKIGFVAHVFSQPPIPGLADCWRNAAQSALQSFAPAYALCGSTQPKIFGIPLGESLVDVRAGASRTNLAASFAFSPTFILNNLAACGATIGLVCQPIFPAMDSATMGFGLDFPDPVAASVDALNGRLNGPEALAAFARQGFDHLLANATLTIGYQVNPFGFKLADGEGRAVFPNLTAHPARPGAQAFVPPEQRGLPSRLELLLGALRSDLIANPLWKGSETDIHLAFPEGSPQRAALQGRGVSFARDYFPHGGILGAGRIAMPRLLVDAPPEELGVVFDASQDPLARLGAVADVIGNYLLQTSDLGTLAFYVPAPNPPFFADGSGNPLTPESLLRAIGTFDLSVPNLANPYPFAVSFLRGEMEGRLIGIPIARAEVVLQPASAQAPAFLRATAAVPADSWLQSFLQSASLAFEIRQSPPLPIEVFFGNLQTTVVALASQASPPPAVVAQVLQQVESGIADALPKVSMELQVNNLRIPDPLTNLLTTASASAGLFAYSPRFEPGLVATSPVQRVRRDGGIAMRGSFRFADLVTINNAELAVTPKLNPVELPALSGLFSVGQFPLAITTVRNASLEFNTEPAVGEPFLRGAGSVDPVIFRNPLNQAELLSIRPLAAGATSLAGRIAATRTAPDRVAASLTFDPARVSMPMLGPDVSLLIHGATPNTEFSLSTTEPWGASVSLQGALSVRDLGGTEVVRIGAGTNQQFSAALTGRGFEIETVDITLPGSLELTVFPTLQNLGELPRTYRLGSGQASLVVRRDGSFTLNGTLGSDLSIPTLPTPVLSGGAALTVTQSGLTLAGNFQGGLLAPGVTASGTLEYDVARGVSLTGEASIPPQAFDVFRLQGVDRPELRVRLFRDGYALATGARLQIVGVAGELLSIAPFTNRANADFTTVVTSGDFLVPSAFRVSGGRMELRRRSGVVSLLITNAPTLTLLPGAEVQTTLAAPFTFLSVASDGQFYADSGQRAVNLFGGASLRGRLEIGNVAGSGTPSMSVAPSPLAFGTVDFGSVTSRVLRLHNTGDEPLVVGLLSSSGAFVPARTDFALAVGESADIPVEFRPSLGGATNAQLSIVMNPGGAQPAVALSGTARPVPIFAQNPAGLSFGSVALGKTVSRTLTVRNLGIAPLVLSNATVTGPFTVAPAINQRSIAPGASLSLSVTYTGTVIGVTNGALTLVANDSVGRHTTELSGTTFAERWLLVHEGGPTLHGVAMLDASTGWAVGEESTLLRTDDGGRSWRRISPGFGGDFRSIAVGGDRVAVAGHEGVVGLSTDRGTTWRRVPGSVAAATTNHWETVLVDPDGRLILAGSRASGGGIVALETASGFQAVAQPAEALHAMAQFKGSATLANRLMAVGDGGRVLRSADGGLIWTSSTVQPGLPLRGVTLTRLLATETDPRVLIVGDSGMFLRAQSFVGTLQRTVFTLLDFRAATPGFAVGRDGLLVQGSAIVAGFAREDATGAYDLNGVASGPAGAFAVGQAGQIWFRPSVAPTGPYLTLDPGHLDFGVLGAGQTRSLEVRLSNRGPAPLNIQSATVVGSSAFSVSPAQFLNVPSNGVRTLSVRFSPSSLGYQSAVVELTTSESAVKQRIQLEGRAQANDWQFLAEPAATRLVDLQMVSDNVAFAATAGQVLRTSDRGTNWTAVRSAPGTVSRVHFASPLLGFVIGGDVSGRSFPPCTNDCQSFILRTGNAGTSWSSRPTGVGTPVADLHMAGSLSGYAVTRSESSLFRTTPGDVLKTVDGGVTWTLATRPVPLSGVFNGSAVHAVSASTVFVAGGGELYRSTDGGASWARVLNLGTTVIADLQFTDANHGVLVGSGGAFRRTTTGGGTSTAWAPQAAFTSASLRRVHFLNTTTGWITGADASNAFLFRTDNSGATWIPEIREPLGIDGGPMGISARSGSLALATDGSAVLRTTGRAAVLPGVAAMPAIRDFGMVSLGLTVTQAVVIRNIGSSALTVGQLLVSDPEGSDAFTLVAAPPTSIPAFGVIQIQVRFTASALGRRVARLVLGSDGFQSTVATELVAEGRVFPTPITFETEPPGLPLNVDGRLSRSSPVTVTVVGPETVPDDVINPLEWRIGTSHTVSAPTHVVRGGFEYVFQSWQPAQRDATLSLVATNVPATHRAVYVPVRPVSEKEGQRPALAAVRPANTPPDGLPHGPFVRISDATLTLPGLGEAAVSGSALLASDRFSFALGAARFGDPGVVAVEAGSWAVAYTNAPQRFVVRTQNPGLTVLGTPVMGESQMTFDVSRTHVAAQIRTLAATPFIPGIAELGPATIQFTNAQSGSIRVSSLATTASLRALPKPGGGFAVERSIAFRASDGPFTNAITAFPNPILDTPLLALRPASGARLEIRRDAQGVYGVSLTNLTVSLLGGTATPVAGTVAGGRLQFTTGRTLALGQLVYSAGANPSLEWDLSVPSFRVSVPAGSLTVPGFASSIPVTSGLVIDTAGDFDARLPLPALQFDGIGINAGGPISHNFIRFHRVNGVAGFQVRDRRSFFDNTFRLKIDVDTGGVASGRFEGELVLRDFLGCDEIGVGDISLAYDSREPDFQFQGRAVGTLCSAARADFRVQFGSGGGRVCHLICVDGCAESACMTLP